jgi:hypothetical protein
MKTEIQEITPSIAREMLKRNSHNRTCNEKHVDFLKKQMLNGTWLFDGQPIRFNEKGALLDGQHRLTSVAESGTTQKFLVIEGIENDAFKVMDTGKNRNGGDVFSIRGIDYPVDIAAAIRLIIHIDLGSYRDGSTRSTTNTQLLEWYDANDGDSLLEIMREANELAKAFSRILPRSWIASFKTMFSRGNETEAKIFIDKLCYGLDLERTSPIYVLRKRLMDNKMNKAKLPTKDKVALIIKAWNMHRKGETCKFIRWNGDIEPFPTIL